MEGLRPPLRAPFEGGPEVLVVLPCDLRELPPADARNLEGLLLLMESNRSGLEAELGSPFRFVPEDPGTGPRWLIGPRAANPAIARLGLPPARGGELFFDPSGPLLVTDAPDVTSLFDGFSLLRNLSREGRRHLRATECGDVESAIRRVVEEVADTWPTFTLRPELDWPRLCERYASQVRSSTDPMGEIQAWLSELGDAHTWARPMSAWGSLSFQSCVVGGSLVLTEVPVDSPAWRAGARRGFVLQGEDVSGGWRRTAASAHQRPLLTGLRMFSGPLGEERHLRARSPSGIGVEWSEPYAPQPCPISHRRLPSGAGYLRIPLWLPTDDFESSIDAALSEFRGAPGLVVDLRGNTGGRGSLAVAFRDRFLREATVLGSVRFSQPGGTLGRPDPIVGYPTPPEKRWGSRVRFLTDPLTYSSSEAVLALRGLEHVQVVGLPSGGGSGQVRTVRMLPGWRLTVSSCLVYDRMGRCLEGTGVPVDIPVPAGTLGVIEEDQLIRCADRW